MEWQFLSKSPRALTKSLLVTALIFAFLSPHQVQAAASKKKVFILTSTYGVLTGTMAGLASLAFYSSPGKHGRNVALGASLGLYTGILLGAYIVYATPDPKKEKQREQKREQEENRNQENQQRTLEENPLNLEPQRTDFEMPTLSPLMYADSKGRAYLGFSYNF